MRVRGETYPDASRARRNRAERFHQPVHDLLDAHVDPEVPRPQPDVRNAAVLDDQPLPGQTTEHLRRVQRRVVQSDKNEVRLGALDHAESPKLSISRYATSRIFPTIWVMRST